MPATPSLRPLSQAELAERWHAIGEEWMHWWMNVNSQSLARSAPVNALPFAASSSNRTGPFDAQALAALNERYRPKWEAL